MSTTFVSHLECSLTGRRYEAGRVHGLSEAGRPLLVRYDLAAMAKLLSKEQLARSAEPGFWRYAAMLPVTGPENRVSLGEVMTPLIPLDRSAAGLGALPGRAVVKDEGRLPTGSFKARGLAVAVAMAKEFGINHLAIPTNGNAGAAMAAYARRAGHEGDVLCPADTPEINVREIGQLGADLAGQRADQRLRQDNRRGQGAGRLVRPLHAEGALPDRGQEDDGAGAGGADGLAAARRDLLSDRRRHRPDRDVEGVPGAAGAGLARRPAAADGGGPGTGCAPIVRAWEQGQEHARRGRTRVPWRQGSACRSRVGDFLILRAVRESGGFLHGGDRRGDPGGARHVATEDGLLLCPEGAATVAAYQRALAEGRVRPEESGRPVQLRHRA